MNRGRRGENIFENNRDRQIFIALLKETAELWDVRISAYCQMTTHYVTNHRVNNYTFLQPLICKCSQVVHICASASVRYSPFPLCGQMRSCKDGVPCEHLPHYHILAQAPQGNLSRFMRHLNGVYTQRYNSLHGYDGQLFRGRFKSSLVEEDSYLLELVRYIHRNPLRAGMVEKLDEYAWSSHRGYLSRAKDWDWFHKDFILTMLASGRKKRTEAYLRFMEQDDSKEFLDLFERTKWPSLLGSENFISWSKETYFEKKKHRQVPESIQLAHDRPSCYDELTLKNVCRARHTTDGNYTIL